MSDFTQLPNLASERLGARVLSANDDFFASSNNLLKDSKPIFIAGKYTTRGKWMDGWETRRRRTPGHDWCIIRLGLPGVIRGIVVDTSFFTGNYPERFSLDGCDLQGAARKQGKNALSSPKIKWVEIFPETALQGDSQNLFHVENLLRFTHLRFRIYPDGGVARLRIHGEALPDGKRISSGEINLAALENGASIITSSDQFYGAPGNLLMPYPAKNMGEGWETKRRRGPGNDWVIVKLGIPGSIRRVEIDTTHFMGNFPDSCSLEACNPHGTPLDAANAASQSWQELLPKTKLHAHRHHSFKTLPHSSLATHVRFQIHPDGGVSRLRVFGLAEARSDHAKGLKRFNRLPQRKIHSILLDCCGATKWAEQLAKQRPFSTPAQLFAAADAIWFSLTPADWLEAFRHHPPIGGSRASAKQSAAARKWSSKEQSSAQSASPELLDDLANANKTYAAKFGFVFLICASGKSAAEILNALRERMPHSPESELPIAAEEQRKITRLRLEKLLNS